MKCISVQKTVLRYLIPVLLFSSPVFAEEPAVRVAILQEVPSARVTVLVPCRVIDTKTGALLRELPSILWQEAKPKGTGIALGSIRFHVEAISIEPKVETIVRVNAHPYRGSLALHRMPKGNLTVVNRLGLEDYLVGALASEVNPNWPMNALKAHAVVSRTLIAHRIWVQKKKEGFFDATADTGTHLYHGVVAEREGARAAVEATKGQVLSYGGELLSATFHANCGGHTEDAAELWEGKGEVAALQGRPDPYCRNLKHYHWQTAFSMEDFVASLGEDGKEIGRLSTCEILERNRSGRVRQIRLVGDRGSAVLPGKRFRELLGANRLRSLKFTVEVSPNRILFSGTGWGHGVGLCQWGSYGMASRGKSMDDVLSFYFPNAKRRKLQGLPGFTS